MDVGNCRMIISKGIIEELAREPTPVSVHSS
jgi:hypothetical protein